VFVVAIYVVVRPLADEVATFIASSRRSRPR
jgi:hypothetical protein